MKTYLVLDCNYLCWRAFHSTGSLSFRGQPTGVIYGFLRDIETFRDLFGTNRLLFCFDSPRKYLLRRLDYPGYKSSRDRIKELPKVEYWQKDQDYKNVHIQMNQLRKEILPNVGYRNIFYKKGFEADDLIASIVHSLGKKEEAVIIGSDHDLFQLLGPRIIIHNPTKGKTITEESFSREFGVTPIQWIDVKAIAGCKGDDVIGVKGIGEITACKFLNGKLNPRSAALEKIVKGNKTWTSNRGLVKLPYPGTPRCKIRKDKRNERGWKIVLDQFGIKSLKGRK